LPQALDLRLKRRSAAVLRPTARLAALPNTRTDDASSLASGVAYRGVYRDHALVKISILLSLLGRAGTRLGLLLA
jgi:hypothetical protein